MSTSLIQIYAVKVLDKSKTAKLAFLSPAEKHEMLGNWTCDWENLWNTCNFDCEAIIKLSFEGEVKGLVKFGLYPYNGFVSKPPEYLEILNIEAIKGNTREVNPVGYWLIWYAVQIALYICRGDFRGSILTLDALEDRRDYYEVQVKMEGLGWTTISPSEEGYAYRFTENQALAFSERLEGRYGFPLRFMR